MTLYAIVNSSEDYKFKLTAEQVETPDTQLVREIVADIKEQCEKQVGMRSLISLLRREVGNIGEFSLIDYEEGDEIDQALFGADKPAEETVGAVEVDTDSADVLAEGSSEAAEALNTLKAATAEVKAEQTEEVQKPVEDTVSTDDEPQATVESTEPTPEDTLESTTEESEEPTEYTQEQIDAAHKLVGAGSASTKDDFKDSTERRQYRKNSEVQDEARKDPALGRIIEALEQAGFPLVYVDARLRWLHVEVPTSASYNADKAGSRDNTFIDFGGYGDPIGSTGFGVGVYVGGKSVTGRYRFDADGYCKKANGGEKKPKDWVKPEDTTQSFIDWVLEACAAGGLFAEHLK